MIHLQLIFVFKFTCSSLEVLLQRCPYIVGNSTDLTASPLWWHCCWWVQLPVGSRQQPGEISSWRQIRLLPDSSTSSLFILHLSQWERKEFILLSHPLCFKENVHACKNRMLMFCLQASLFWMYGTVYFDICFDEQ